MPPRGGPLSPLCVLQDDYQDDDIRYSQRMLTSTEVMAAQQH